MQGPRWRHPRPTPLTRVTPDRPRPLAPPATPRPQPFRNVRYPENSTPRPDPRRGPHPPPGHAARGDPTTTSPPTRGTHPTAHQAAQAPQGCRGRQPPPGYGAEPRNPTTPARRSHPGKDPREAAGAPRRWCPYNPTPLTSSRRPPRRLPPVPPPRAHGGLPTPAARQSPPPQFRVRVPGQPGCPPPSARDGWGCGGGQGSAGPGGRKVRRGRWSPPGGGATAVARYLPGSTSAYVVADVHRGTHAGVADYPAVAQVGDRHTSAGVDRVRVAAAEADTRILHRCCATAVAASAVVSLNRCPQLPSVRSWTRSRTIGRLAKPSRGLRRR